MLSFIIEGQYYGSTNATTRRSTAFCCFRCGRQWAQIICEERAGDWDFLHTLCASHNERWLEPSGSIWLFTDLTDIRLPRAALLRELSIHLNERSVHESLHPNHPSYRAAL